MMPEVPDVPVTLAELLARPAWQEDAMCRGRGTKLFFSGAAETTEKARVVCGTCSVREECLAFALADSSLVGVFGGTTEGERREMRRRGSAVA